MKSQDEEENMIQLKKTCLEHKTSCHSLKMLSQHSYITVITWLVNWISKKLFIIMKHQIFFIKLEFQTNDGLMHSN